MRISRAELLWIALAAILLLLICGFFPGTSNSDTDSYSVARSGKKVLFQSLRRLGQPVARSHDRFIPRPELQDRILVLGPNRVPTDWEWEGLLDNVALGGALVYAADGSHEEVEIPQLGVKIIPSYTETDEDGKDDLNSESQTSREEPEPATSVTPAEQSNEAESGEPRAAAEDPFSDFFRRSDRDWYPAKTELVSGQPRWKVENRLEFNEDEWAVLVSSNGQPQVITCYYGDGDVIVSATDEIFSNESMTRPDSAVLAFRILEWAPTEGLTWFDETLNRSGVPKVFGILFDAELRTLSLQLLLLVCLFGWAGSRRFGPALPPDEAPRRSIVEHAEALGGLYYRAGAARLAVDSLREFYEQQLRRLYGSSVSFDHPQALARLTQSDPEEITRLARAVRKGSPIKLSAAQGAQLLRKMSRFMDRLLSEPARRRDAKRSEKTRSQSSQPRT